MTSYTIPPNTRADGTGNPPADMDAVASVLSLLLGLTPSSGGAVTAGTVGLTVNSAAISGATGAVSSPLSVIGSSAAGQLAYIEQDSSTDHGLIVAYTLSAWTAGALTVSGGALGAGHGTGSGGSNGGTGLSLNVVLA